MNFYFDFISPYAYLGFTQLHALEARLDQPVVPVPVLFAALLDAHGQRGPGEIPTKRAYVFKHALRIAHRLGVPFGPPASHPFNPLLPLRVASLPTPPATRRTVIHALFAATWAERRDVSDPAVLVEILLRAELDGPALVERATQNEAKATLRRHTEQAIRLGVFGVPTIVAGQEVFWGFDAFDDVVDFCEGRDPAAGAEAAWNDIPATAIRPGSQR